MLIESQVTEIPGEKAEKVITGVDQSSAVVEAIERKAEKSPFIGPFDPRMEMKTLLRMALRRYLRTTKAVKACESKDDLWRLWGNLLAQLVNLRALSAWLVTQEGLDPENPECRELLALEEYARRQQGAIYE